MPRFVILTHDHPFLHWDLMLEAGPALRTWRLLDLPDSGGDIPAEPLPDHRLEYLTYEGPLSADRGTVRQWDAGQYALEAESPHRIEIRLDGRRLRGRGLLDLSTAPPRWTFRPDSPASLGG